MGKNLTFGGGVCLKVQVFGGEEENKQENTIGPSWVGEVWNNVYMVKRYFSQFGQKRFGCASPSPKLVDRTGFGKERPTLKLEGIPY